MPARPVCCSSAHGHDGRRPGVRRSDVAAAPCRSRPRAMTYLRAFPAGGHPGDAMSNGDVKVAQWFEKTDWLQAGGRIAAILVVTFVLVYIARRLIGGLEKFTASHA